MEKEQRSIPSMLTGKSFLIVLCVIALHHYLHSSVLHNLGIESKVTNLAMDSMLFFQDSLLHLQVVFRVVRKNATVEVGYHYTNSSSLEIICTNGLMNATESITNRTTEDFSGLLTYDMWSLGRILYHIFIYSPLCNVDTQQINSLLSVFKYHCFHFLVMFMIIFLAFSGIFKDYEKIIKCN